MNADTKRQRLMITLKQEEQEAIDAVRGTIPMATWIRDVACKSAADQQTKTDDCPFAADEKPAIADFRAFENHEFFANQRPFGSGLLIRIPRQPIDWHLAFEEGREAGWNACFLQTSR